MADFKTAFDFMMVNEDGPAPYRYKTVDDTGGFAISGINSKAFPDEFQIIASIPQAERGSRVENFYKLHFWNQWLEQLESDDVAKRVFDAAVNMGSRTGCKILQKAINALDGDTPVTEYGQWGPSTVKWANTCHSNDLVNAFKTSRLDYYAAIVEKHPENARYFGSVIKPGPWWVRAVK